MSPANTIPETLKGIYQSVTYGIRRGKTELTAHSLLVLKLQNKATHSAVRVNATVTHQTSRSAPCIRASREVSAILEAWPRGQLRRDS